MSNYTFRSNVAIDTYATFEASADNERIQHVLDELQMCDVTYMSDIAVNEVISDLMDIAAKSPIHLNQAMYLASGMLDVWREEYEDGIAREENEANLPGN